VVSDGEQILGIGDQGSGGIGISSAKAAIYTLVAGIDPAESLAVCLDVGTNNEDLRNDPLYLVRGWQIDVRVFAANVLSLQGWNHERVRGERYDEFVDKFVQLVMKHQPQCLLHFEDFVRGEKMPQVLQVPES
jgi:malate dehydrogenase (oxaloacetate-decarboxylating)